MAREEKCGGCGHAAHRGLCRAKGPSRCVPLVGDDGHAQGMACYGTRPPCTCAWRTCKCGMPLAVAIEMPAGAVRSPREGKVMLVSVQRGSAGASGGRLAVWKMADGTLGCRDLTGSDRLGQGEWRGTEHDETRCGYALQLR